MIIQSSEIKNNFKEGEILMSSKVKIFGCAWSPRHGNTEIQVQEALKAAEELPGVETSYYSIVGKNMAPCDACYRCFKNPSWEKPCPAYDDPNDAFDDVVNLILEADGIIFGCPVYFMSVTAQLKAFMDRSMGVEALGYPFRNKVAGFVTIAFDRHGGHEHTIREMLNWAMMHDMITVGVGPERPPKGIGGYIGAMALQGFPYPISSGAPDGPKAIRNDDVGMFATRNLGKRVAEMAKIVKVGFASVNEGETFWPKEQIKLGLLDSWKKE
jgi:multimeric flavodoxin WrbA